MPDIVLIGGGVIGLSLAFELASRGASVRVLDQGPLGRESSWAGAGMITPGNPALAKSPETRLRAESFVLWPDWAARLREESGIDTGFARCGGIELPCEPTLGGRGSRRAETAVDTEPDERLGRSLALPDQSAADIAARFQSEGVRAELLGSRELRELEPNLNPGLRTGVHLPDYCQVRNPRLLKALLAASAARGVELSPGSQVLAFDRINSRVTAVRTPTETISAEQFVVCSGAWSQSVLAQAGGTISVAPVRGQIVLLEQLPLPTRRILEVGSRYVVPRADGKLLIGSTEEHVGFEKSNTSAAVAELLRFGTELLPSLKNARFDRCWSGLRPGSPSGLPYLGRVPHNANLFIAAGHFRAGLMLSPITAVVLREMLLGDKPVFDMFQPFR